MDEKESRAVIKYLHKKGMNTKEIQARISATKEFKFKRLSSVGKVIASVFWNCEGVITIDYLQKGQTTNMEYYASNVLKLNRQSSVNADEICVLVFCCTSGSHRGGRMRLGPVFPCTLPSRFGTIRLIPKLKFHLCCAVEGFLRAHNAYLLQEGIAKLEHWWCIEVQGDHVEK